MAALDFEEYRDTFLRRLAATMSDSSICIDFDPTMLQRTYRWDTPKVASFKYLFNFVLDCRLRDQILKDLFEEKIDDVKCFAGTLYVNSEEARQMQAAGMIIGGHSHHHKPLSSLTDEELEWDLNTCHRFLTANLHSQEHWPFCYPYGKKDSFNSNILTQIEQLGFVCSFSTEVGSNVPGENLFALRRLDCKDV